jgi:hypothetical protein
MVIYQQLNYADGWAIIIFKKDISDLTFKIKLL